ncbi:MAG: TonB-dependent receptor plug domain-containing protein [Bacteroidales bacterium]
MKRAILVSFLVIFCFHSLKAQNEKKDPLIVINGKISILKIDQLDSKNIVTMNVIKYQDAKDSYGVLAENGVIYITTKDYKTAVNLSENYSDPLVLLDGTIYTSKIEAINTQDIESISVLKDKAANMLYGKAGDNGVILIKTKSKEPAEY